MRLLSSIVLLLILLSSTLLSLHAPYDHHHDASCEIYVLEELFVSDIPNLLSVFTALFVLYSYTLTSKCVIRAEKFNYNPTRAPPYLS